VRVLILSWEYPPIVEGGLARHVRKLSEQLVAQGVDVHVVVTRGGGRLSASEDRHGVTVHRVREPDFPKDDLDAFIAWVEHMNADILAAALELDGSFDLVHSHDWLVADAARALARRFGVPWLVTVHATEYGRHQGWVDKHPQSHIHAVERRMVRDADRVITLLALTCAGRSPTCSASARARDGDRERDRPDRPAAGRRPPAPARAVRGAAREARAAGRPARVREGLPPGARRDAAADRAARRRALPRRRIGDRRGRTEGPGRAALAEWTTARSSAGQATTCCTRSTGSPTCAWCRRCTSRSASWRSRRWASGCPCIVAATGGLREVVPGGRRVGLRFRARDSRSLARMAEQLLSDDALRDRLVAEAGEWVLRFDWADVARQTAEVYGDLRGAPVS